jgi:hypothetical protein
MVSITIRKVEAVETFKVNNNSLELMAKEDTLDSLMLLSRYLSMAHRE